jgi:hypothetical protein
VCAAAAASGKVDVLWWLREHGCDWDEGTSAAAAANDGSLILLPFLLEHGCPWNIQDCLDAAAG